jgi:leader peptidase (prepilin peptidase)/N-methyltransferase
VSASAPLLVALLYLAVVSVVLAVADVRTHRLPDAVVLPAYPVLAGLLAAASACSGDWAALVRGGVGLAVVGSGYLLLATAVPGGLGLGDVKLAGVLGLVLAHRGWTALVVGSLGAFVVGGVIAAVLVATGRAARSTAIPFGPSMLAAAWVGLAVDGPLGAGVPEIDVS